VWVLSERRKTLSESDKGAPARRGALRASVCAAPSAASSAGTRFTCFTGAPAAPACTCFTGAPAAPSSAST
jgi:hypothetical protein